MARRVVVTGLGVITSLGNDLRSSWEGILAGKPGFGPITRFDPTNFSTRFAAEVKGFDPLQYIERKEARRMDLFLQFGIASSVMAVEHANLKVDKIDPNTFGVIIGSGIGGISTIEVQHERFREYGPSKISPFFVPMMISNIASGCVAIQFNARGPNYTTVSACASGAHAIGDAFRWIKYGDADVMIAGGTEAAITEMSVGGFCSMKALSTRNDEPLKASRPFDLTRDGFVLGEGAGVVILEELGFAEKRGADIIAEVVGYGMTADAHHITAPDPKGEGAARAMALAMKEGKLESGDVDYINAHGTSTEYNDKFETKAIKDVFGEHAEKLAVSSTKSMIGHLLGAAGGVEFVFTVLAVKEDKLPPTINYEHPDPECDLDYVPNVAREGQVRVALTNSFGFGGHNTCIAVKKYEG
ncbi:MAG: beta-ketoacyl-ACP synthase II [Candidatus Glassbacteria bacterium]